MRRLANIVLQLFIVLFLTIITQIGGLVYFISYLISNKYKLKKHYVFPLLYLLSTFLIVPFVAPLFGREKVKHTERIKPTNYLTVLLNRNYVRPQLNDLLVKASQSLDKNISIHYLDANFPFINKFPLLPHLSHNDGKKIDLSLIYQSKAGLISAKQKSRSGYGVFEAPKKGEHNQIAFCKSKGYFQYDYPKYMTFGSINEDLVFSSKGTKELINAILKQNTLGKLFIEPHLKTRLKLSNTKIRYHGCRAVRHDDHIHIQLRF